MITKNNEVKSIAIADGSAVIIDVDNAIAASSISVLYDNKIINPRRSLALNQTRDILINSGIIRFEENKALLNFVIQESVNRTIMPQLGKVAEAIIVKRCFESEEVKYRLFCIATGKKARKETVKSFEACGTSLIDTKISHMRHYNPQDMQRDIIFVNKYDKVAFMSNATSVAGECAGLQIKTSNDIVNYIFRDIISGRYCVPIICFPLMAYPDSPFRVINSREDIISINIYDVLINRILKNRNYVNILLKNNQPFFNDSLSTQGMLERRLYEFLRYIVYDINDIDTNAFEELLYIKSILEFLVNGRITPDDLLHESKVLNSYLMSLGLEIASPSVENNNIFIST